MKRNSRTALLFSIAAVSGWWIAGSGITPGGRESDAAFEKNRKSASRNSASAPSLDSRLKSWSTGSYPLEEFEDIRQFTFGGPFMKMEQFLEGIENDFLVQPGRILFESQADWLGLDSTERNDLKAILTGATILSMERERTTIHTTRLDTGSYRVIWKQTDPGLILSLKNELVATFGEQRARSIWFRGGLENFFEPVPGWKHRGVPEIEILITPRFGSGLVTRISNGKFHADRYSGGSKSPTLPVRLRHLLDISTDLPVLVEKSRNEMPVFFERSANRRLNSGFMVSPHTGNIIDVRGIAPGTLVRDPGLPPEAKAYFRVPPIE